MLIIDYTLPRISGFILFLDAPFRYSWRHLIQYFNSNIIRKQTSIEVLSSNERMMHFGIAFLEILPILGMLIALLDWFIFSKKPKPVTTRSLNDLPTRELALVEFEFEKILPLYSSLFGHDAQKEAHNQERYILPRYIQEMKDLAHHTGISYEKILVANTILDRLTLFGGSIKLCTKNSGTKEKSKVATNYFHSQGRGKEVLDTNNSFWRFDKLSEDSANYKQLLYKVSKQATIASLVYDGQKQKLYYAFGSDYAANRPFRGYDLRKILNKKYPIVLLQNIDLPMGILAPFTRIFVHERTPNTHAFVSVGWLGILGTYSGINEHGLAASACSVPEVLETGKAQTPNQFIIRQILEEAKTIEEANIIIKKSNPAACMNLLIATEDSVQRLELGRLKKL